MRRPQPHSAAIAVRLLAAPALAWSIAAAGPSAAQTSAAPSGDAEIVAERQDRMARMLDSVNRVAPRLGSGAAAVNPAHWPLILDTASGVAALLRESRAMWPARSDLGWGSASRALPGLWTLPDAFARHYDDAEAAVPKLLEAARAEDAPGARRGFCRLVAACGACHAAFRKIDYASLYREGPHWLGRYPGCAAPG